MSTQKSICSRDSLPLFVEFVGPVCSGKTTLITHLKSRYENEFSYIGAPDITRLSRVMTRLREELFSRKSLNLHPLDEFSKGRLIKGFSKVLSGIDWYAKCRGDIFVVDEGPFRVMMDYASHSVIQYEVWRKFCRKALEDLSQYRVLVVFVEMDSAVRIERYKQRVEMSGGRSPDGYSSGEGESPKKRRFFREEAISLLEARKYKNFHMVTLVNDDDVEEVTFRARQLIHDSVAWEE